jgi:polyisoprenoid-binding protein YceI
MLAAAVALSTSVWATGPAKSVSAPAAKATAKPASFKVNTEASTLVWLAKKVTGEHTGTLKLASGTIETAGNKLTGGTFAVNMESITVTDLKDAEYNGKLVGHLKSPDFFDIANHKTATLVIKSVKAGKEANAYDVTGDLTIKGITKPITFPATVTISADKVVAVAKVTVDRTNYDIKYGSGKFFANIGDKAIYDDFTLDLNVVAGK